MHRCKSEVEPATNAVAVAAFEVYLAPTAVPQPLLVWVLNSTSIWDNPYAYILASQRYEQHQTWLITRQAL
jgi:hypothetical protein